MIRPARPLALLSLVAIATAAPAQFQGRIYPAPRTPLTVAGLPDAATLDRVVTADRLTLTGIEIAGRADRPVVLVFHGNASDANGTVAWLAPLVARGYGIVAAEYRGYAGNAGKPDEPGLSVDADAFYARAKALAGTRRVIVLGHSLGGGVAFSLARRQRLDALVTIGAFSRLRAMAPRIARAFITDRWDNADAATTLDEPLYLIHGTADDIVPLGEAQAIAGAAAGKCCAAWILPGADHRPDGAMIVALVDVVAARLDGKDLPVPDGVNAVSLEKWPVNPSRR